jgi:hypothetical protein
MWADQDNWPADRRGAYQIRQDIQEFITKAMQIGGCRQQTPTASD